MIFGINICGLYILMNIKLQVCEIHEPVNKVYNIRKVKGKIVVDIINHSCIDLSKYKFISCARSKNDILERLHPGSTHVICKFGSDHYHILEKNRDQIKVNNVKITLIRHAESCANYSLGNMTISDQYINEEDMNKISTHRSLWETIMSQWAYEPPLTIIGMFQAAHLGINKDIANKLGDEHSVIICSNLTRTIMTSMLAMDNVSSTPKTIYVVPYISEERNILGKFGLDKQNTGLSTGRLIDNLLTICMYVSKEIRLGSFSESVTVDNKNIHIRSQTFTPIRYTDKLVTLENNVTINFSILEKFEELYNRKCTEYSVKDNNIGLFYLEVLPELIKLHPETKNFVVFSHGHFIRNVIFKNSGKLIPNLKNIQIIDQDGSDTIILPGIRQKLSNDNLLFEKDVHNTLCRSSSEKKSLQSYIN